MHRFQFLLFAILISTGSGARAEQCPAGTTANFTAAKVLITALLDPHFSPNVGYTGIIPYGMLNATVTFTMHSSPPTDALTVTYNGSWGPFSGSRQNPACLGLDGSKNVVVYILGDVTDQNGKSINTGPGLPRVTLSRYKNGVLQKTDQGSSYLCRGNTPCETATR